MSNSNPYSLRGITFKQKYNSLNTTFGVINRSNQMSSYITVGAWVKTIDLEDNFEEQINLFKRKFKVASRDMILQLLKGKVSDDRIIRSYDYSTTSNSNSKARVRSMYTYFEVELTLFFNNEIDLEEDSINTSHQLIAMSIADMLVEYPDLSFVASRKSVSLV